MGWKHVFLNFVRGLGQGLPCRLQAFPEKSVQCWRKKASPNIVISFTLARKYNKDGVVLLKDGVLLVRCTYFKVSNHGMAI